MPVNDATAAHLMLEFGRRTGLSSAIERPRRYLWTDAFAVCNFLELFVRTGEQKYKQHAILLIDQVHQVLGRYRQEDVRSGWISGLDEKNGLLHPTLGGLRIGKPLKEREYIEPFDERLEWDRDGQYFHYLTKWMHALSQTAVIVNEPKYAQWAGELAFTAFERFGCLSAASGGLIGIYWKMSTDLSRPLVAALALHDLVDGLITLREVGKAMETEFVADGMNNAATIKSLSPLCRRKDWTTDDPLGLGGLLFDVYRLCLLFHPSSHADVELLEALLDGCSNGLGRFVRARSLAEAASNRLAFRELGLAIGLKALPAIAHKITEHNSQFQNKDSLLQMINLLQQYVSMSDEIVAAWLPYAEQQDRSWRMHQDINEVMLSTALIPNTFLSIGGVMQKNTSVAR